MKPSPNRIFFYSSTLVALVGVFFLTASSRGATIVWSGADLVNNNTNWSDPLNWAGGAVPGGGDDVKFFDAGAVTAISNINNTVDATMTIGSLQYGNTNNNHTTLIPAGVTLNVTNATSLFSMMVGESTTTGASAQQVNATVTGPGALVVSNRTAFFVVNQGAGTVGTERATLDLTGLNTVNNTVKSIFVGSTGNGTGTTPTGNGAGETGTLLLGKTNVITVVYAPASSNYPTNVMAFQAGISVGYNGAASAGGTSFLYLGQNNTFNVDSISVGQTKGLATVLFGPAFTNNNPVAVFRSTNGGTTRVSYWAVGDTGTRGGSGSGRGTNDFTYGTLDAMVNILTLGQDTWAGSGAPGDTAASTALGSYGVFNFPNGSLNVNTLTLGNVQSTVQANTLPCLGIMNVGSSRGSNATLQVNTVLQMTFTQTNGTGASSQFTYGNLNVTNGTVLANSITVGTYTASTNNRINLTNSTLIVSNALATSANPLTNYYSANSLLGLTVTSDSATKAFIGNLTTGGTTNLVQLGATPVFFGSYPAQIALIKYSSLAGSGYNFGLTNVPGWAPGASLSNNVANKSVDLVLPSDPRPIISTQPSSYSGSPGDNVTFSVTASGVAPLNYQWLTNGVSISDGPTGNGSANFGSTTATLIISNAQPADSVSAPGFSVVITNLYGSITSSPAVLTISGSAVIPSIAGPTNLTVIQGNNVTINDSVSGSPLPVLQWLDQTGTPIPGATTSSLTLNNVQYSQNGFTYSLVASNSAGMATNVTTLTVIVPPTISVQPVSLVVTNTQSASFTVISTDGVPAAAFQWKKNGTPITDGGTISGSGTPTLSISAVTPSDIANYSVTITILAGITISAISSLTVNSTMSCVTLLPANNQIGVCYDTPLYVTFNAIPVLRNAGKIKIYNVTNSAAPVDTLDLSLGNVQARSAFSGDGQAFNYYPVIITGSMAAIYPHSGVMTSNQTYYVTIDDGTFADTNGAYFAGTIATNVWQFATKVGGPTNVTNLVVAKDYSGDFATVQGAVDFVPAANTTPRVINIQNGNYVEIVDISGKNNLLLRGQNRAATIVGYPNNALIATGGGSTHSRMAFKVNANDISLDNLTITNSTAQDAAQAEALMIESGAARIIVNNCNVDSYQDTILANQSTSKAYFNKCLIQGDVDFIWGGGNLFFTNCEVRWLIRSGNSAALGPNPSPTALDITSNGFSFVSCSLTTLPGANPNDVVGRTRSITNGNTALINCFVSTNIGGWNSDAIPTNSFRNWYFGCTNDSGASVTLSNGIALSATDPNLTNANSANIWLYGWQPQLSPNIVTQPAGQSANGGQQILLNVGATAVPDPSYQWLQNGTPVPGATNSTLIINSANVTNAGMYSVIVTNIAGSVSSSNAVVTVGNTAPTLAPVSDQTVNVGVTVTVTNIATDPDVPPQTLTFSLLAGPTNATLDASSGIFTWRPLVTQAGSTNAIAVIVADNGTPNLSATNSFNVIVNPLTQPSAASPLFSDGQFSLTVNGQAGPDYAVQVSTNLASGIWTTIFETNSPAMPFTFTDTNAANAPAQFYRIVVGPPLP